MRQVNVSINGRSYLLNCGEDEEGCLLKVTEYLNDKISKLDKITKQSGDTNLMLAAALLLSNDVLDLRAEAASLQAELEKVKNEAQSAGSLTAQSEAETMEAFTKLANRIETLANTIAEQAIDTSTNADDSNSNRFETLNANIIKTA